jgi:signal peptidase II
LSPRANAALIVAGIAIADRATKLWVQAAISPYDSISVIPGVFHLVYTRNRGAAFGLLSTANETVRLVVLVGFSLAILAFIAHMLWQATRPGAPAHLLYRTALALVLGGAAGNLYDRILEGSVTDFLQVFLGSFEWPSFNVADSAISVGAALIAYELLFHKNDAGKESPHVPETH